MGNRNEIKVEFIPTTSIIKQSRWRLLCDYVSHNGHVNVPAGYVTDGATVPVLMRWVISPTGSYFGAAIVHDYILDTTGNWDYANSEFKSELSALKTPKIVMTILMYGVRFWAMAPNKIKKSLRSNKLK